MIKKELNFKDGSKGLFLKNGISGAMLYGTPDAVNKGNIATTSQSRKSTKRLRIAEHLEKGLMPVEIARKVGMTHNLVNYYFNALKKEKGKEWTHDVIIKQLNLQNQKKPTPCSN